MIITKNLRHLILACLVISMPAQSMGWFDSMWKKLGLGVAATAALIVIIGAAISLRTERYVDIELARPPELPVNATPRQEISSTFKAMLDQGVDFNFNPKKCTYFFIKDCTNGIGLMPVSANRARNLLERCINTSITENHTFLGGPLQGFVPYSELVHLIDDHARKKNSAAIAEHVHQFNFQTQCHSESGTHTANFNTGVSDIIGAYAAERDKDTYEQ
jgi:hypothetical protein